MSGSLLATVRALGSVAGLVSIVGLAVLSALYVLHARGVKRLREWAGCAPENRRDGVELSRRARRRRSRARRAWVLVGLTAVGVMAVYGATRIGGGEDDGDAGGSRTAQKPPRSAVVRPGAVTVAVLNGTTVDGLAAALREQIAAAGFRGGTIDVFADQQRVESVVQHAPGQLAAAKAVGRVLGISRYERATASSRARAGDATVIVVAGADQATAAP